MLGTRHQIISLVMLTIIYIFAIIVNEKVPDKMGFFTGNLIPEFIGICIEILIIVLIFEYWQNKKEHQQLVKYEKRLREYLIFFLKNGCKSLPNDIHVGDFYGHNYDKNKKEIQKIIDYMNHNDVDIEILKEMKYHLRIDKTAFENLLEVASLLTEEHMKAWLRIVFFINKLTFLHGNDKKELKITLTLILRQIRMFDTASYNNKIYVNAK